MASYLEPWHVADEAKPSSPITMIISVLSTFSKIPQSYGICDLPPIVQCPTIIISKRGLFNEPRNVAIYLIRRLRGESLKQIGEQFQMKKYSSVSSVIERIKTAMAKDGKLRNRVESIVFAISKNQEQTPFQ